MSQPTDSQHLLYVHLSDVDFAGFPKTEKGSYVLYGGNAKRPRANYVFFNISNKNKKSGYWTFALNDPYSTRIKLTLYKTNLLGELSFIGELTLSLSSFELNRVVSHSFPLKTRISLPNQPSICLDVHLTNKNQEPFYAFPGRLLDDYVLGEVVEYDYIN